MLRILHIEDDPIDAELIYSAIAVQSPCHFSRVASKAGLEAALAHEIFDLIISDSSLPGFDGAAALTLAKKQFPDVPFVFCSGHFVGEKKTQMLNRGATDYFSKDDLEGLIHLIKDLLGNSTESGNQNLRVSTAGEFQI